MYIWNKLVNLSLQDEVLAYYEKIVLKLSDLAGLIVHDVSWSEGRSAFTAEQFPTPVEYKPLAEAFSMNSFGLDNRDIRPEKSATGYFLLKSSISIHWKNNA